MKWLAHLLATTALWGELVAPPRSEPGRGYLLELDRDGRWVCACEAFRWRGDCSHVRAAYARTAERRIA